VLAENAVCFLVESEDVRLTLRQLRIKQRLVHRSLHLPQVLLDRIPVEAPKLGNFGLPTIHHLGPGVHYHRLANCIDPNVRPAQRYERAVCKRMDVHCEGCAVVVQVVGEFRGQIVLARIEEVFVCRDVVEDHRRVGSGTAAGDFPGQWVILDLLQMVLLVPIEGWPALDTFSRKVMFQVAFLLRTIVSGWFGVRELWTLGHSRSF
jgi:hypothetical protein